MPRILGIDIPKEKRIETSLTYIYGIGRTRSNKILEEAGISPDKRAQDLTDQEVSTITSILQARYQLEGDLRRAIAGNIKRLMLAGTYRGLRHKRNLPVRGQRTKTNARTRKGPKRTVGVMKDKGARKATAAPASENK